MSDLDRVRDMYTWAIAWRAEVPEDREDLRELQATLRAEFDAAVAAHVAKALAEASLIKAALRAALTKQVCAVRPEWIAEQRDLGWPDMHPEDWCHRCGARNPVWCASAEDWKTATAAWAAETGREGICCPACFQDMYAEATGTRHVMVVAPWRGSWEAHGALLETSTTDDDRDSLVHLLFDQVTDDWDENDIGILADAVIAWMSTRRPSPPTEHEAVPAASMGMIISPPTCAICGGGLHAAVLTPDGYLPWLHTSRPTEEQHQTDQPSADTSGTISPALIDPPALAEGDS